MQTVSVDDVLYRAVANLGAGRVRRRHRHRRGPAPRVRRPGPARAGAGQRDRQRRDLVAAGPRRAGRGRHRRTTTSTSASSTRVPASRPSSATRCSSPSSGWATAAAASPNGLGLGLAVARGFIHAIGGELTFEDTPGGGATFVFTLRRAEADDRRSSSPTPTGASRRPISARPASRRLRRSRPRRSLDRAASGLRRRRLDAVILDPAERDAGRDRRPTLRAADRGPDHRGQHDRRRRRTRSRSSTPAPTTTSPSRSASRSSSPASASLSVAPPAPSRSTRRSSPRTSRSTWPTGAGSARRHRGAADPDRVAARRGARPHEPGHLVTQAELLQGVWGPKAAEKTHYLRVQMAAIRRKVEPDPARPRYFITAPGLGLRFDPPAGDRLQPC